MTYCIINCTVANKDDGIKIAQRLIEKKLIACCNIVDNITSLYTWDNKLNTDSEALLIMKTKTQLYAEVEKEIKNMHSYDVPEIICTPIIAGSKEYVNWIEEQTKG